MLLFLYLFFLLPLFFFFFDFIYLFIYLELWVGMSGNLKLGSFFFLLSGRVHTGISDVCEAFHSHAELQLKGPENNFTEIMNQDLVLRGASSQAAWLCCQVWHVVASETNLHAERSLSPRRHDSRETLQSCLGTQAAYQLRTQSYQAAATFFCLRTALSMYCILTERSWIQMRLHWAAHFH